MSKLKRGLRGRNGASGGVVRQQRRRKEIQNNCIGYSESKPDHLLFTCCCLEFFFFFFFFFLFLLPIADWIKIPLPACPSSILPLASPPSSSVDQSTCQTPPKLTLPEQNSSTFWKAPPLVFLNPKSSPTSPACFSRSQHANFFPVENGHQSSWLQRLACANLNFFEPRLQFPFREANHIDRTAELFLAACASRSSFPTSRGQSIDRHFFCLKNTLLIF